MSDTRTEGMISQELERKMLTVKEWRDGEDGREAVLEGRWRPVEEDESQGLYEGTEGILIATLVGAPQYGNERVDISYMEDGNDMGVTVDPLLDVETVD